MSGRRYMRRDEIYSTLWKAFEQREFAVEDAAAALNCSRHCAYERLNRISDCVARWGGGAVVAKVITG